MLGMPSFPLKSGNVININILAEAELLGERIVLNANHTP
jgi:hypothetical protein